MNTLCIRYCEYGSSLEKLENHIADDINIGQLLVALADRLELDDSAGYKLVLAGNGQALKKLDCRSTLADEGVQNNDKLVLILHEDAPDSLLLEEEEKFLVTYTLTLKIPGVSPYPQYSIHLNLCCENNPKANYFANPDVNGRLKFEKFLQDQLAMDLGTQAIDKLIDEWCDDISVGYRNSEIEI